MTLRTAKARLGITLTEILISILIMGVGLVSLATLFPLGLIRLRQANQQSRSSYLAESALADLQSRDLLNKRTFLNSWYGGFNDHDNNNATAPVKFDPFLYDIPINATSPAINAAPEYFTGGGLPVCYDPLFRAVTGNIPLLTAGYLNPNLVLPGYTAPTGLTELRFGAGVVYVGNTPVNFIPPEGNGPASAHGLQRITNFLPFTYNNNAGVLTGSYNWNFTYPSAAFPSVKDVAGETFASPEDIVVHEGSQAIFGQVDPYSRDTNLTNLYRANPIQKPATVVPQLATEDATAATGYKYTGQLNDWRYTWFFTGRQNDVLNGSVFTGDIVVCDNRSFGVENLFSPISNASAPVASGEFVYEAIFGYSGSTFPSPIGYAVGADRTVMIHWPIGTADPEIKVGSWIADVTYERTLATSLNRVSAAVTVRDAVAPIEVPVYPMQRCHWYQVGKRTQAEDDPNGGRRMVLYVTSPLKAKTLLNNGGATIAPVHYNAALFMPSVVNVFSRTVISRNGN